MRHNVSFFTAALLLLGCGGQQTDGTKGTDGAAADAGPDAAPECSDCLVLIGGRVFDGKQAAPATVVIRGQKIDRVTADRGSIPGARTVDLAGKTILPGLMDLHVHSTASGAPYGYTGDRPPHLGRYAAMLRAGVTGHLDLGTAARRIFEYRDRLERGAIRGPALYAAGPLVTAPGCHPCYGGSPVRGFCVLVGAPEDVARLETELWPDKPDVLKLVIEDGSSLQPLPRISGPSIAAVLASARKRGVPVVAHVSSVEDMQLGFDQGVRRFAHMPAEGLLTAAKAKELAKAGVSVIPTLAVYQALHSLSQDKLDLSGLEDDVPADVLKALADPAYTAGCRTASYKAWTQKMWDDARANFKTCLAAGITIVAGTDAGNPATFHGWSLVRELELYVELGMSPARALAAATSEAARFLGRSDVGEVAPGKLANLLVVDGDPLEAIGALRDVHAVYLRGEAVAVDQLSVTRADSLAAKPVTGLDEGAACFADSECDKGKGLVCDLWGTRCTKACDVSTSAGCPKGSACFARSQSSSVGYCMPGDGCDLFAQDCQNDAACLWIGNGATSCWYGGTRNAGDSCDDSAACAPGLQCNYYSGTCYELCHPEDPAEGSCDSPDATCQDLSSYAGLPVGQCL